MRRIGVLTIAVLVAFVVLYATAPSYAAITGTITATDGTVALGLPGPVQTGVVQLSGTWTATVVVEGTVDGTTWFTLTLFSFPSGTTSTSVISNGQFAVSLSAMSAFRARASAFTSGTITVALATATGLNTTAFPVGGGGASANVNIQQIGGTAQSGANVVDVANTALRVNVVASTGGGGVAQLQVRNSGDTAWVNIGVGAESASVLKVPVRLHDASGNIAAILNSAPAGTEYALLTRNIPSGTQTTDLTDRAARLLGIVYGSQSQQLKQTATNFNLQVELAAGGTLYDARSIRALTSSDIVTVVQSTAANLLATVTQGSPPWTIRVQDGSGATLAAVTASNAAGGNALQALVAQFNTVLPTVTSGNAVFLQTNSNGELRVVQPTAANLNVTATGTVTANQGTPANWAMNLAQVAGTATVNGGLAGTLAVGGTAANNAAINQNPLLIGAESISIGTQPTASTSGNQRRLLSTLEGTLFTMQSGANQWSCSLNALVATLTQCQAAPGAGLKLYVTDIYAQSSTATGGNWALQYGTGANCATGTTALFPKSGTANRFNTGTNFTPVVIAFNTPLAPAAANAICAIGVATNTLNLELHGFIAP